MVLSINKRTEISSDKLYDFFQENFDKQYEQNEIDVTELELSIEDIKTNFKPEKNPVVKDLVSEYGEVISTTVINAFGLGPFFHQKDQTGGQVTTIHNAQNEIYANEQTSYRREKYKYKAAADQVRAENFNKNGAYIDGYTGKVTDSPNVDHIVPLKSFHKNGGFMLSDDAKANFASDKRNLIVIDGSVNKSKSDQSLEEFISNTPKSQEATNKERFGLDGRRTRAAGQRGNEAYDDHAPTKLQKATYYTKEGGKAAVTEGLTLGIRQAWGMFMYVFSKELFEEFKKERSEFKRYYKEKRLTKELKAMLSRVVTKVKNQLSNIMSALGEGIVSGFFSSILTTIINCFKTTTKRIVRIIREGVLSIVRAIKMLIFPPKDMTYQEAIREAIKLLVSGLFVAGGLFIEEIVEKKLVALGIPGGIANIISTTLVGIMTGICIVTVVYLIDKLVDELPSTKTLVEKSKELMQHGNKLELQYSAVSKDIFYDKDEHFMKRIKRTDQNVDDMIDFFDKED
ncbi:DUF1524 domain-containing protein [Sporosarcina sp. SAFN-015]|uniref:DUF1524 domain-containing protein n=1 Tax=Sporosarcina sp. SAFN-015 TaxID=3387274 RepID=UPI003F81D3B3